MQKGRLGIVLLVTAFLFSISSYCPTSTGFHILPSNSAQQNLVAHWQTDEGFGLLMHDVSVDIRETKGFVLHNHKKNENHGMLQQVQWINDHAQCVHGTCLYLDGKESHITFKQQHDFPISNHEAFTIMLWVRGKPQQQKTVYAETVKEERSTFVALRTGKEIGNKLAFVIGMNGEEQEYVTQETVFDDAWHHVVFIYQKGRGTWYIDGVKEDMGMITLPTQKRTVVTMGARLGQQMEEFFEGYLSGDMKLYQRTISEEEAQSAAQGICTKILRIDFGKSGSTATGGTSTPENPGDGDGGSGGSGGAPGRGGRG